MARVDERAGSAEVVDAAAPVGAAATEVEVDLAVLLERLVRDGGVLALAAAAGEPRRLGAAAVEVAVSAGCVLALVAAFVLVNVALVDALGAALPGWRAPLLLGGVWMVFGLGALARLAPRSRLRVLIAGGPEGRRDAVAAAEGRLRSTLEELTATIARQAEERLAAALLPVTGRIVETGEEVVDAADEMIEAADEVTDVIEARLPGGVVVNRVVDVGLVPGRLGIRVVRRVFELSQPRA